MIPAGTKDIARQAANRARDELDDILTDALCVRLRELTGKEPSSKTREEIWFAVHYRS